MEEDLPETDLTLGIVPEEDTEEATYEVPERPEEDAEGEAPEVESDEADEGDEEEDEKPAPQRTKSRPVKEPKGRGKKAPLEKKVKKNSGGITISGPKRGSKKSAPPPASKPPKGKKVSQPVGSSKKPSAPKKSTKQKVDDFDANFGKGSKKYSEPAEGESIVSQMIGVVELIIGGGLMFFGASQLGNILINNILSKAIGG